MTVFEGTVEAANTGVGSPPNVGALVAAVPEVNPDGTLDVVVLEAGGAPNTEGKLGVTFASPFCGTLP